MRSRLAAYRAGGQVRRNGVSSIEARDRGIVTGLDRLFRFVYCVLRILDGLFCLFFILILLVVFVLANGVNSVVYEV